jgi:hypothetical protein
MKQLVAATLGLMALTAWSLAAQGAPAAAPRGHSAPPPRPARAEPSVPFSVGETLTYDVSWSAFLTAGTVVATVRDRQPAHDSTAYYIVAEGRPTPLVSRLYPLYYKLDTLLDAFTLLSHRGSLYAEEGSHHTLRTTTFDRSAQTASFEHQASTTTRAEFSIPPGVQDLLSAVYALRAMGLKPGGRIQLAVSNDGITYRLQVAVASPERVKSGIGDVSAWKLSPTVDDASSPLVGRNIGIWLTDDTRRLPVKLQSDLPVGAFVLTLREAR